MIQYNYGNVKTQSNIYIIGVFTETPDSKPLEHNLVYIPIIVLNHIMSHDFK